MSCTGSGGEEEEEEEEEEPFFDLLDLFEDLRMQDWFENRQLRSRPVSRVLARLPDWQDCRDAALRPPLLLLTENVRSP
jgi:hypothetical protein